MPRRNHPSRSRARQTPVIEPDPSTPTTEQLARHLVTRGLASPLILDRPFRLSVKAVQS